RAAGDRAVQKRGTGRPDPLGERHAGIRRDRADGRPPRAPPPPGHGAGPPGAAGATVPSGAIVLMSAHTVPGRSPARAPSGPSAVAWTAAVLVSMVNRTSTWPASSRGVPAQPIPASSSGWAFSVGGFPPDHRVPGVHHPPGDAGAHRAEAGEADAFNAIEHARTVVEPRPPR